MKILEKILEKQYKERGMLKLDKSPLILPPNLLPCTLEAVKKYQKLLIDDYTSKLEYFI
jgi:hypothetical protein